MTERDKLHPNLCPFARLRNYQVQQQAFFLAILNSQFEFTICKPRKQSNASLPFYRVNKFIGNNCQYGLKTKVKKEINRLYSEDIKNGVSEKTAKRRKDLNRINVTLNILANILEEYGCKFTIERSAGHGRKREVYGKVEFDGCEFTRQDIERKGNKIVEYFSQKLEETPSKGFELGSCDVELMGILFS